MIAKLVFGKILMPLSYYARGDLRYKYLGEYLSHLHMTSAQVREYQLQRMHKLLEHAYATVPYYKKMFASLKLRPQDIKSLGDLSRLPVLRKRDVIKNFAELQSANKYAVTTISSGGSTGNRVTVLKDKRYHEISRAVVMRDLHTLGIEPGDKVAWVWGSPIENQKLDDYFWHRVQWFMNRRILFNSFNYTDEQLEKWLRHDFTRFRPDYLYGYANTILEIAKFIKARGIRTPQLKKVVCSAQKLEKRKIIEEAFNCRVYDHYGSREIESIAIEDDNYVMHSSDDFVIAEISEKHEILLTPLESYAMPLIRYAIGDIGLTRKTASGSSHPFSEFSISIGRSVEILRTRKGERVYSGRINREMAERGLKIGEFQLIQKSYDDVDLNIVKDELTDEKDVLNFVVLIKRILGAKNVNINYVSKYPTEKSGKKISYKCLIKDENPDN